MRALTVRQPWAWAIIHGGKDVENRTRNLAGDYRGPIAIHAGRTIDSVGFSDDQVYAAGVGRATLTFGAFIGVVDLLDVHACWTAEREHGPLQCCPSKWAEYSFVELRRLCELEPQTLGTVTHLVLGRPRPLPEPIPARGQLGLWTPPPAIAGQITTTLEETR